MLAGPYMAALKIFFIQSSDSWGSLGPDRYRNYMWLLWLPNIQFCQDIYFGKHPA